MSQTIPKSVIAGESTQKSGFVAGLSLKLQQIRKAKLGILLLMPAFLLMTVFIAYPLVRSLYISLFEWNGITNPEFVGLENFRLLIKDHSFYTALWNTLAFAILTTLGTVLIGFLLAFAIERRVIGWAWFKVVFFLPVMVSVTVVGLLWGKLYDPTFGPINVILQAIGIENPPVWLGDPDVALYAIIAVSIWQYVGFPMIVFLAAMENIPLGIHDAATIDGVNGWQRLVYIIFPLVSSVFAVIVMLQIIFSLKVFDIVWVMTQGGPGESTTVLGVYLYRNAFVYTYFGYGSAVAVAMTAIIFTLSMVYQRFIRPDQMEY